MPYDENLAKRLRALLASEEGVTEKRMFGGLAFLVHGNICVGASHTGGLLARIDPEDASACWARPHVEPMRMRGRTMEGWVSVAPEGLKTRRELASWVDRSLRVVRGLPRK